MEWISFFDKQPINGQKIFYYGESIGVWSGTYKYCPDDLVSPHLMVCEERNKKTDEVLKEYGLNNLEFVVDRMDAPWWMKNEGQEKPAKPSRPYPKDYPK